MRDRSRKLDKTGKQGAAGPFKTDREGQGKLSLIEKRELG
jgi:hypothetical protein